jgi:hypothetical protein
MNILRGFVVPSSKGLHHLVQFLPDDMRHSGDGTVAAQAQGRKRQGVFTTENVKLLVHGAGGSQQGHGVVEVGRSIFDSNNIVDRRQFDQRFRFDEPPGAAAACSGLL